VIAVLGFELYEYSLVKAGDTPELRFDEELADEGNDFFSTLVNRYRRGQPVLIYCLPSHMERLRENVAELIELELVEDHSDLQELDKKEADGGFKVFATASEKSMRGLDFRAPKAKMMLVVAAPFSTPRDFNQGMSRVGRFGDKCTRVKLGHFLNVDAVKAKRMWTKLLELVDKARPNKETYAMIDGRKRKGNKR